MVRGLYIAVIILFVHQTSWAQLAVGQLQNASNIHVRADGILFGPNDGKNGFVFPINSNKTIANLGGLWLSAQTADAILLQSSITNPQKPEFWPGPIDTLTRKSKTPDNWNFIYPSDYVTNKNHRANFSKMGYQVPANIASWPGNSMAGDALPAILAPYVDFNKDGLYNPAFGDYPLIKGDATILSIYNDEFGEHATSGGVPLKAQMLQAVYAVRQPELTNCYFVETFIKNYSDYDWKDFYIGFYTDLVLGNSNDNYVKTDVDKNAVMGYNGDDEDEGLAGYGASLPFYGMMWLNHKISSSTVFDTSKQNLLPRTSDEMRNVMLGKNVNGETKTNSLGTSTFAYPGKSDFNNTREEVSEESEGSLPGERKILSVIGPLQVSKEGYVKIDFVFFADTASDMDYAFNRKASQIVDYYNQNLFVEKAPHQKMNVYPNPLKRGAELTLEFPAEAEWHVEIYDQMGRIVFDSEKTYKKVIIASNIIERSGLYYIKVKNNHKVFYNKLIVN